MSTAGGVAWRSFALIPLVETRSTAPAAEKPGGAAPTGGQVGGSHAGRGDSSSATSGKRDTGEGAALRPPSAAAATPAPQNSSHRDADSCRGSGDGGLVAGVPFSGKRACIPRLRASSSRLSSVILFKRPVAQYTHGRMPNVTGHFWESFALFLWLEKLDRVIMEQTDLLWSLIMS